MPKNALKKWIMDSLSFRDSDEEWIFHLLFRHRVQINRWQLIPLPLLFSGSLNIESFRHKELPKERNQRRL